MSTHPNSYKSLKFFKNITLGSSFLCLFLNIHGCKHWLCKPSILFVVAGQTNMNWKPNEAIFYNKIFSYYYIWLTLYCFAPNRYLFCLCVRYNDSYSYSYHRLLASYISHTSWGIEVGEYNECNGQWIDEYRRVQTEADGVQTWDALIVSQLQWYPIQNHGLASEVPILWS